MATPILRAVDKTARIEPSGPRSPLSRLQALQDELRAASDEAIGETIAAVIIAGSQAEAIAKSDSFAPGIREAFRQIAEASATQTRAIETLMARRTPEKA